MSTTVLKVFLTTNSPCSAVFKMSSICTNADLQLLPSLADRGGDNAVLQCRPLQLQLLNVADSVLKHTLHDAPNLVIDQVRGV